MSGSTDRLLSRDFLFISGGTLGFFLASGALLPALALYIEQELNAGNVAVGLGVGGFAFSAVLVRPFAGRIGDRHGRRVMLFTGGVLLGLSTLGFAVSHWFALLFVLRLVNGVADAFFFTGASTVITDIAPVHRRGEALSYFSVSVYLGLGLGPLLSEFVLQHASFPVLFSLAGGLAFSGALLVLPVRESLDRRGLESERTSERTRLVHPAGLRPGIVFGLGLMGLAAFMSFVALRARDVGLDNAGYVFLTYAFVALSVRVVAGRVPDRIGPRAAGTLALAGIGTGHIVIGLSDGIVGIFVGTVVFGAGQALLYPALLTLAVSSVPDRERGAVVGTFTAFLDVALGLGGVVFGVIATVTGRGGAFVVAGMIAAGGMVPLRIWIGRPDAQDDARMTGDGPPKVRRSWRGSVVD